MYKIKFIGSGDFYSSGLCFSHSCIAEVTKELYEYFMTTFGEDFFVSVDDKQANKKNTDKVKA